MPQTDTATVNRRDFLKSAGAAVAFLTALSAEPERVIASTAQAVNNKPLTLESSEGADVIVRMQVELQRALQKKPDERRWVMVIDLRKCVGCHACTIACVAENKLPPGVVYRPVMEEEHGVYPLVTRRFIPRPCMQCDNPPCTPVCPVSATYKGEEGVVQIDYEQCIGCRACITACPYGARTSDFGYTYLEGAPVADGLIAGQSFAAGYERAPNFEYGKEWAREEGSSPIGNARKCHFCLHRVMNGMLPECVATCIGRATLFGDANDPDSLVTEMIHRPNVMRLKEDHGTEPRVYYMV
ncbi:MAG: 4Fe-4S dicluster domain-containing protein [Chloroflexi bacterium]|nr:4Fe-4S dicluster domain-containing protein [Chloroflexota bacterium]